MTVNVKREQRRYIKESVKNGGIAFGKQSK